MMSESSRSHSCFPDSTPGRHSPASQCTRCKSHHQLHAGARSFQQRDNKRPRSRSISLPSCVSQKPSHLAKELSAPHQQGGIQRPTVKPHNVSHPQAKSVTLMFKGHRFTHPKIKKRHFGFRFCCPFLVTHSQKTYSKFRDQCLRRWTETKNFCCNTRCTCIE